VVAFIHSFSQEWQLVNEKHNPVETKPEFKRGTIKYELHPQNFDFCGSAIGPHLY
jgi:hypothetical protein